MLITYLVPRWSLQLFWMRVTILSFRLPSKCHNHINFVHCRWSFVTLHDLCFVWKLILHCAAKKTVCPQTGNLRISSCDDSQKKAGSPSEFSLLFFCSHLWKTPTTLQKYGLTRSWHTSWIAFSRLVRLGSRGPPDSSASWFRIKWTQASARVWGPRRAA